MEFLKNRKDLRGVDIQSQWKVIMTQAEIMRAVQKCADYINSKFEGKDIVIACILKGAVYFFVDLTRLVTIPHSTYFIEASSYGNSQQQQQQVEILSRIVPSKFQNKTVVLIDELIDNGHTISNTKKHIAESAKIPESNIFTITLFKKKKQISESVDFFGVAVPDVWLVGYGLDDQQEKRNWTVLYGCPKIPEIPKSTDDKLFDDEGFYQQTLKEIQSQL